MREPVQTSKINQNKLDKIKMGASESKEDEQSLLIFTEAERNNIHSLHLQINGNHKMLTEPFLKKFLPKWLEPKLHNCIFPAICNCRLNKGSSNDGRSVSEGQFGRFLAQALKGDYSEKTDILCLLSGNKQVNVSLFDLYVTLTAIVKSYLELSKSDVAYKTWCVTVSDQDVSRLCKSLLDIQELCITEKDERQWRVDEVQEWLSKCPLFLKMFDRVLTHLFQPVISAENSIRVMESLLPIVKNVDWKKSHTILDELSIGYINYHLPRVHQTEWRLLYSNSLHGDSFAQLVRFITGKGPNVLVVRDKDGHTFGAFVTEGWELKPKFYGSPECFLFSLSPKFGVYTTSGYNENFMYFNQGQETLPNGLGLGGQLNYFGLWIDYSFNSGHSKALPQCTTYGSPQLSGSPEFEVDSIEVWAVGPEKKTADSDEDEYAKTSILDKDLGAKAILEMAGKKQHSEGLRELVEDEGPLSDEMKRKMNVIPKMF